MLWILAVILCSATAISGAEIVWLFLLAGAFGAVYYGGGLPGLGSSAAGVSPAGARAVVRGLTWTGSGAPLGPMAVFFAKAGAFTFGSGWRSCPPAPGADRRPSLADRAAVRRRGRDGPHQPRPGSHHGDLRRLSRYGLTGAIVATAAVFLPVYSVRSLAVRLARECTAAHRPAFESGYLIEPRR